MIRFIEYLKRQMLGIHPKDNRYVELMDNLYQQQQQQQQQQE